MINRTWFAAGIDEYRPSVMWFWNDVMDEVEICRQMDEFVGQKINQVFIHPLSGIEEVYLSDRFLDLVGIALSYARKLGIQCWIYDEYNWPSGTVGGTLIRDYPEYRTVVVRHQHQLLKPGEKWKFKYPGEFISAQAVCDGGIINISDEGILERADGTFIWMNSNRHGCEVYLFSVEKQRGILASDQMSPNSRHQEGYLDMMNPQAVRKFIDLTHEKYAERFSEYFGNTIAGFFTDEPCIANMMDYEADLIPWTRDFAELFHQKNGYDLPSRLVELVSEVGDYRRTRYDFWNTLTERFSRAYAYQVATWCEERQLMLTGHCMGEEAIFADLLQNGSAVNTLQYFHIPGIDSVFSKNLIHTESFNLAAKMGAGAAEYAGAERLICETFTGSGWDTTLEDMKHVVNRLTVLGVNFIQFMGSYYSLRGLRKFFPTGYPPSHSFQLPAWSYYGMFSDYISRICYASTLGVHGAEIAILQPTTSLWSEYAHRHSFGTSMLSPGDAKPYGDLVITERTIHGVNNALLQIQRDFDLLPEQTLLESEIVGGMIIFRGHAYKQLIVPSLVSLTGAVWEKLQQFINFGGSVCFINMIPHHSPDVKDMDKKIEQLCGFSTSEAADASRALFNNTREEKTTLRCKGRMTHILTNEWEMSSNKGLREALQEILSWYPPQLELLEACEHIFVRHRKLDNEHLFLIVNDKAMDYSGTIRIQGRGQVTALDPRTGHSYALNSEAVGSKEVAGETRVQLTLCAREAILLELSEEQSLVASESEHNDGLRQEMDLSGIWTFSPSKGCNYLRLSMEVSLSASDPSGEEREWIDTPMFEFPYLNTRYKVFPEDVGFGLGVRYEARSVFRIDEMPRTLELIMDPEEENIIYINGQPLSSEQMEYVWDRTNMIYDLREWIKPGDNTLIIQARIPDWEAKHIPVFAVLRGEFGVTPDRSLTQMPTTQSIPGSWTDQGFPDYSGESSYRCIVDIDGNKASSDACLTIDSSRDVIECWCNGQFVGRSLWNPHSFNLAGRLIAGENVLELKVANTLANLLEGAVSSGLTGVVKLGFADS